MAFSERLEGRTEQVNENHEMAMTLLKQDQDKFQTEIRVTLTDLKQAQNNQTGTLESNSNMGNLTFGRVGFNIRTEPLGHRYGGSTGGQSVGMGDTGDGPIMGDPGGAQGLGLGKVGIMGYGGIRSWIFYSLTETIRMGGFYKRKGISVSIG